MADTQAIPCCGDGDCQCCRLHITGRERAESENGRLREVLAHKEDLLRHARMAVGDAFIIMAACDPEKAARAKKTLQDWISASMKPALSEQEGK